jgi:hypothetical protein
MQIPSQLYAACWGALGGAVALAAIGFMFLGWTTSATADQKAERLANRAVITALAPICVDKFQQEDNASANLAVLKMITSWQQGPFIEKGGWATMPGSKKPNSSVADACADLLKRSRL